MLFISFYCITLFLYFTGFIGFLAGQMLIVVYFLVKYFNNNNNNNNNNQNTVIRNGKIVWNVKNLICKR